MEKLKVGDKYLTITLAGHNTVAAFKNVNKKKVTDPDYTGNGVAVWINTKKADGVKTNQDDLM